MSEADGVQLDPLAITVEGSSANLSVRPTFGFVLFELRHKNINDVNNLFVNRINKNKLNREA
jgi:hypothetical protein